MRPLSHFREENDMNLDGFKELFCNSKLAMPLDQAEAYIRKLRDDYPIMDKNWTINRLEYNHRMAMNTACVELANAIHKAAPWEDYREIIADYEWPFMQRVLKNYNDGRYNGQYGEKIGLADAWIMEMWLAYDEIFHRMPGVIKDTTPWKMLNSLIAQMERNTRKYRRKL